MNRNQSSKNLEREFKRLAKERVIDPRACKKLAQTRMCILELHQIIKHFEQKFNYVPDSARVLFNEYNKRQEKMLYEKFKEEYSKK